MIDMSWDPPSRVSFGMYSLFTSLFPQIIKCSGSDAANAWKDGDRGVTCPTRRLQYHFINLETHYHRSLRSLPIYLVCHSSLVRCLLHFLSLISAYPSVHSNCAMAASFFNNKARAAAAKGAKPKDGKEKEDSTRLQPWVEK